MSQDLISKLNEIKDIKQLIKQAIIEKGVEIVDTDLFSDYATRIAEIQVGIDTKDATALANDILANKTAYVNDVKVTGIMPNNTSTSKVLTTQDATYIIPGGHHDGTGTVIVVPETKNVTPTKTAQNVVASEGKVLSNVNVAAIPNNFTDSSDADATAANILSGKTAYVNNEKITGNIALLGGATITPGVANQVVAQAGKYISGNITVLGDENLIPANIKSGISIFGISGSYEGSNSSYNVDLTIGKDVSATVYYTNKNGILIQKPQGISDIGTDIKEAVTTYGPIVIKASAKKSINVQLTGGTKLNIAEYSTGSGSDTTNTNIYVFNITANNATILVQANTSSTTQNPGETI